MVCFDAKKATKRITIQRPDNTLDAIGGDTGTFSDVISLYAIPKTKSGRETWRGDQNTSEVDAVFVVRYRSDIDSSMRIKVGSSFYSILSVINTDEANVQLELVAKKVSPDANSY